MTDPTGPSRREPLRAQRSEEAPPASPPPPPVDPPTSRWRWLKRPLPLWAVLVAFLLGGVLGASGSSSDAKKDEAATTTTSRATTTTLTPTTTAPTTTPPTATTLPPTTTTTLPPEPVQILVTEGGSDKQTDTFVVTGRWQIDWTVNDGAGLGIEIIQEAGGSFDSFTVDPGTDSSIMRGSCTCYLDISTFGSTYSITVTDLPD